MADDAFLKTLAQETGIQAPWAWSTSPSPPAGIWPTPRAWNAATSASTAARGAT
jgi:hypothetical protein